MKILLALGLLLTPSSFALVSQQPAPAQASGVQVRVEDGLFVLRSADGVVHRRSSLEISEARALLVPGSPARALRWREGQQAYCTLSANGSQWSRARLLSDRIEMQRASFDPLVSAPDFSESPLAAGGELYLLQFQTLPLEAYRQRLSELGAVVRSFVGGQAHIVQMSGEVRARVEREDFVRWIGPYHPEYRLESELLESFASLEARGHYYVQVFERGLAQKTAVAEGIRALGGEVVALIPEGFRLEALLDAEQLGQLLSWNEVSWVDRWSPAEDDMDLVRIDGGANALELATGFTGQGVRAECMDGDCIATHQDLQSNPVLYHGAHTGSASHGTPVTGVVFGDGSGNGAARGMLPDGQPIFGSYVTLTNRYTHTAQLLSPPYEAVFQTNSWGGGLTSTYTSTSMEMDDILFQYDLVILQSQSNTGSTLSRPQAWAKNIVSVGAVNHQNTLAITDDCWCGTGSVGPASDGRIKPDLCYWYDSILTTADNGGYTQFGGTSAATPATAGHFGLFYEMWHNGLFGNTPGSSVFASRPKASTARALMFNTASAYTFSGSTHDKTRTHQGWGRADVERLYEDRGTIYVHDETQPLQELESVTFIAEVPVGEDELRVTLVYLDLPGTTSAAQHRINDLSLRATSPSGSTVYWGNEGLKLGNWSTPGGVSDTRDVVENVFLQNPEPGFWTIEVLADELNGDSHVETPQLDADFALVINGTISVSTSACSAPTNYCTGAPNSTSVAGAHLSSNGSTSVTVNNLRFAATAASLGQPGIFYYGSSAQNAPFGDGVRCVGGAVQRSTPVMTNFFGDAFWNLDITSPPQASGQITAGSTWYFQFWYRDPAFGGAGHNLTDAIEVGFCN